jgi:glutathione S-transferase
MAARLKIFGLPRSRAFRNFWLADEIGLPYEMVTVQASDRSNATPEYLAINPNGRVPAILDDGFALWESLAINLYLAKKYGGAFYPRDPEPEALTWQWSFWAATEIDKQIVTWANHTSVLEPAERDPVKASAARAEMERPLAAIDRVLAARRYLADPNQFTVADLNVAVTLYRALKMDLANKPKLAEWLHRCWDRPAGKRARALRE